MASNEQSRSWWLLLFCAFVAGILFGYYLLPHKTPPPPPHTNTVAFNILPGAVQAAPKAGDKVVWWKDGKPSDDVHIHFYGESPCAAGGDGHTCTITEAAKGQFMYYCSDKADPSDPNAKILCQDPGIDPNSGTDGLGGKLQSLGSNVVFAAQRPKPHEQEAPKADVQIPATNLTVVCRSNAVTVLNPSTTPPNTNPPSVKVGGLVQWNSTLEPIIKMDPNYCTAPTLGDNPPTCTIKSPGDIPYTIEVPKDKCTNPGPTPFHINANTLKRCDC
jgi:hypothetical protein